MLCYCNKCGRIAQENYNKNEQICDCCNSMMQYVPKQFLIGERGITLNKEFKQQFIDDYIKSSPEFDQYLFDQRDEILDKQNAEYEAQMARGRAILREQSCRPECPTCHSKNVQRISGMERGFSIYVFGIFSNKFNKTFKCNHCGYTW